MCLREGGDRLPESNHWPKHDKDGPGKGKRSSKLADTANPHRGTTVSWIHQVLSLLCPELFKNCPTTTGPHKENNPLALEHPPRTSVPGAQEVNVLKPH